jgi:hypothetical protein
MSPPTGDPAGGTNVGGTITAIVMLLLFLPSMDDVRSTEQEKHNCKLPLECVLVIINILHSFILLTI